MKRHIFKKAVVLATPQVQTADVDKSGSLPLPSLEDLIR